MSKRRHPGRPANRAKRTRKKMSKVARRYYNRMMDQERGIDYDPPTETFHDERLGPTDVQVALFSRGKIYRRMVRCGKDDCRCMHGGPSHGPYHYLVMPIPKGARKKGGPKLKWIYLSADEAKEWTERIHNYRRLQLMVWGQVMAELEPE